MPKPMFFTVFRKILALQEWAHDFFFAPRGPSSLKLGLSLCSFSGVDLDLWGLTTSMVLFLWVPRLHPTIAEGYTTELFFLPSARGKHIWERVGWEAASLGFHQGTLRDWPRDLICTFHVRVPHPCCWPCCFLPAAPHYDDDDAEGQEEKGFSTCSPDSPQHHSW